MNKIQKWPLKVVKRIECEKFLLKYALTNLSIIIL